MPFNHGYELTWETVAHALTKGLQLRTRGRLVEPSALTLAQNVEYPVTGGCQKRRGHTSTRIAVNAPTVGVTDPTTDTSTLAFAPFEKKVLPADWLPGYGRFDTSTRLGSASSFETSPLALGGFSLLGSPVTWTGDRFVSATGLATEPTLMPVARARAVASEGSAAQFTHATRLEDGSAVVASPVAINTGFPVDIEVSLFNAAGALVQVKTLPSIVGAEISCMRVVPFEQGAYVYVASSSGGIYRARVTSTTIGSLVLLPGTAGVNVFDVCVCPDPADSFMIVAFPASLTSVKVEKWTQATTAIVSSTSTAATFNEVWVISCDVHPTTKRTVVAWISDGNGGATRTQLCTQLFAPTTLTAGNWNIQPWETYAGSNKLLEVNTLMNDVVWAGTGAPAVALRPNEFAKLTVGFRRLLNVAESLEAVDVWASAPVLAYGRMTCLTVHAYYESSNLFGGSLNGPVRKRLPYFEVAGRAMAVGATPVVPLQFHGLYGNVMWSKTGLTTNFGVSAQPTVLLLDVKDRPVGKLNGGTAQCSFHSFYPRWPGNYVYAGSLSHVTVGLTAKAEQSQIAYSQLNPFQAPVAEVIDLDFIHPLSVAVQGKSAFIAGAQVWEYDGRRLTEANFVLAPEVELVDTTFPLVNLADPEFWRFELWDLSEGGDQVRSASIPYKLKTDFSASTIDDGSLWAPPTWRKGAGFVGFQSSGGSMYLSTTRDPTQRPAGNLGTNPLYGYGQSFDLQRNQAAVLTAQEIHPSSTIGYLQPNSPPACELIATGNNRLWMAGGQVPIGSVTTSLLYQPGFAAGWNDYNTQTIEGLADPVTDFAFLQDAAFIVKTNNVYIVNSDGPDNFGQGLQWPPPRQLSVGGSPYRNTACATPEGVFFLANSGVKLINYAGGITNVGDADPELFKDKIVAAVNFSSKDQVRWYKLTGDAVVFDYREGRFSTWTGLQAATAFVANERAYVVRTGGYLWREAYGTEEIWQDDGASIEMIIRTAWNPMGTGEIGYGRCRRIAWTGEFRGDHNVRMRVFYNESAVHEDEYTLNWATQGDLATSWGSDFWGFGAWGGSSTDKIWRWAWRPSRNKCSVIMFELSDLGANSAGFVPVCYGFEIGRRGGLDRVRMK
jgi:hypothetical protein